MSRYPCFWKVAGLFLLGFLQGSASPTQYYAQVYTEILGRTPTPAEWVANEYRFTSESISVENARSVIVSLFQSTEFSRLGYTPTEKAFVLYRSILLREPSTLELTSAANQLGGSAAVATVASNMMNSAEFRNLLLGPVKSSRPHSWVNSGPSERSLIGAGGLGNVTGAQLQAALDAASPGETVFLSRGALVRTHQPLVIPAGVTLATYDGGSTDRIFRVRKAYGAMGRIVRAGMFARPMIEIMPGGRLIGVWVDGRRSQLRVNDPTLRNVNLSRQERFFDSHNILVRGGLTGDQVTEVSFCKISDSTGWTSIHALGHDGGVGVGFSKIDNNLITCYSSNRDLAESFFTDGISNASSDGVIINNDIVDPSDVGIVIFNPGMVTGQRSHVVGNDILFAGIEGWGGITMDHSVKINDFCLGVNPDGFYNCFDVSNPAITSDFTGTLIQNNLIWSSDDRFVNVGISLGVHLWGLRMFGQGGQVLQNRLGTPSQPLNTGVGVVIAGIREPIVLENELHLKLDQSLISCFSTDLLFDPLSTALGGPHSMVQEGFKSGEVWGMLRAKSNGYIFGEYKLHPTGTDDQAIGMEQTQLKVLELNGTRLTDRWTILHSERNFGDGYQYYLLQNRGNHQVMEATAPETVSVQPFSGQPQQYWRFEQLEGSAVGAGMRLVNQMTGEYLGRDGFGRVFTSAEVGDASFNWKFQRIEERDFDFGQPELMFLNPLGEVFKLYLESTRIFEDRSAGNPGVTLSLDLYSDDRSGFKPIGQFDFNRDGRMDTVYIRPDGGFYVTFMTEDGYTTGGNIGNMRTRETFGWDISPRVDSWEKPVGFMDMGNSSTEDLLVIDREGNFEVGFVTENGLANSKKLVNARDIGLSGATADLNSPIKSIGSGDFDGDRKRELLFVGPAGGLFIVKSSGGALQQAVPVGNPIERFGFGVTSDSASPYKPVSLTDVNGDGTDDLVLVDPGGNLLSILFRNGSIAGVANLGNPQASWNWNLSSQSFYSRPIGIAYGTGWWNW